MLMTSQDGFSDHEIVETLGIVRGSVVRARHLGRDIVAGLCNIIGGEVKEYSKLIAESRQQATDRMVEDAKALGADAIVTLRYTTSAVLQGSSEVLAYGTAVKLAKGKPKSAAKSTAKSADKK